MSLIDRKHLSGLIEEAVGAGARRSECCKVLEFSVRTLQRWEKDPEKADMRAGPLQPSAKQLTQIEREQLIAVATSITYRDLCPAQIVPRLADLGIYIASESSFYRILKAESLLAHRSNAKPKTHLKPVASIATAPNKVWSWDITYLKSPIRGKSSSYPVGSGGFGGKSLNSLGV